jgi:molybdate/tungstate transport system substrate-binding protein
LIASGRRSLPVACPILLGLVLATFAIPGQRALAAETAVVEVAYAGSMGPLMEGPIRRGMLEALGLQLHGRGQGALALAHLIVGGAIRPDVFIAVTPGPMRLVLRAGQAARAWPIARTEMVLAYNPQSRYAKALLMRPWWQVLESPGLRLGRSDPLTDPLGLNTLYLMDLAQRLYAQPDLSRRILGSALNSRQIFAEPELMARLQAGQLDAAFAYRTQPAPFHLPFIELPARINLGQASMETQYDQVSVSLAGKISRPQPLVFYAAALRNGAHRAQGERLVAWLRSSQAQALFKLASYNSPGASAPLTP